MDNGALLSGILGCHMNFTTHICIVTGSEWVGLHVKLPISLWPAGREIWHISHIEVVIYSTFRFSHVGILTYTTTVKTIETIKITFLVNKTNRCTELKFYWYYYSTCFGQPFCPSSGVLSRISALVHFMQLWWTFATRSRMELLAVPSYSW